MLLAHRIEPLDQARDDILFPLSHGSDVQLRLAEVDSHRLAVCGRVQCFGHGEKRLRGNATAVQADATEPRFTIHDRRIDTVARRAKRSVVAARPAADDEQIGFQREFTNNHE